MALSDLSVRKANATGKAYTLPDVDGGRLASGWRQPRIAAGGCANSLGQPRSRSHGLGEPSGPSNARSAQPRKAWDEPMSDVQRQQMALVDLFEAPHKLGH
ncbi:hypothetical protein [Achromobacter denitrificans]|uniref:hypothetical protein n=1 Tax=Achromobacter denitrificans TaxID=32002 RepID=UPI003B9797B4